MLGTGHSWYSPNCLMKLSRHLGELVEPMVWNGGAPAIGAPYYLAHKGSTPVKQDHQGASHANGTMAKAHILTAGSYRPRAQIRVDWKPPWIPPLFSRRNRLAERYESS